ncbi:MAG: hypothetical protein GX458_03415 [Phyllobacteriaceae bacterium]|nr:hypothetical protein [Phyllobacteriaceae bacterium]
MSGQFVHIDAYALAASKGKPSAIGILAEAARAPNASRHIATPLPANVCFGCAPIDVEPILRDRIVAGHDRAGRSVAVSSLVLLTAVASWPVPVEVMQSVPERRARYEDWKARTISFFRELWGEALLSVVEHLDEPFPHLHLLAVPPLDPTGVLSVETISAQHRAQGEKRRDGGGRAEQRKAFRAAAVELQDAFHLDVGAPCGLERLGPRRQRLTRQEALARRKVKEAEAAAAAARETEWMRRERQRRDEMDAYRSRCASAAADAINDANAEIANRTRAIRAEVQRLAEERAYFLKQLLDLGWTPPNRLTSPDA